MTKKIGNLGMHGLRLSGRGASRAREPELVVPPPPPPFSQESGRGAEPVGAPGRTARRLKAGFVFVFFALVVLTAPENARAAKTVTISTASTTITEGDSGKKDVTINVKLGEGTPTRVGFDVEFVAASSTASDNTNVGTTSCSAPSSGADICYPGVFSDNAFVNVNIGTNGSFGIGILGDTVNEGTGETVALRLVPNSLARSDGWTQNSNTLILTITDNDVTTTPPSAPAGLSAEAGNGQVELTWTDPEDDSITRYSLRQKKGSAAWGSWAAIPGSDADTTTHTVTGLDNDVEYRFRIRARNSGGNGPQSAVVRATPVVPTTAGVTLSATSLTVEEGSSNTYTVKLDKAPTANVTITVSGASGDVTVMGSPLTFTPSNFSATQTITVSAARDGDTTDDTSTLTHAASSDDTSYGASLEIDDVDVTVTDTTPTFQLLTDPAAVTEGTDIRLTVTSDRSISGNWPVRLTLAARSSSAFTVADIAGTLGPREFTANFGSARTTGTVTIPTSADSTTEGAEAYRITLSERTTNVTYAVGSDATADGTLNDGTTASVPAAPTGLSATAGNGQVALSWTKPAGNITGYKLRYGKTGVRGSATWTAIAGSGANTESYTVTSLDNDAEYSFQIRAVNASGDGIATGWVTAMPTAAATTPTPPTTPTLPATGGRVTVTPTALTVEEGGSGSYTVALDTEPSGEVTVTVGGASGDVTTSPASLTFTTTNYNTAQTVTVSAAEDDDAATDPAVTLTHSASGGGYDSVSIDTLTVTITEDDEAGVTLSASTLTVEEGSSGKYTVVLDSQPVGGEVTVTPRVADSSVLAVSPSALRFTAANWNTAQMVTVTGVLDHDLEDATVSVSHAVAGGDYEGVTAPLVTVKVTDTTAGGATGRANRINAMVLPQVAAATLSQTLTAVTERIGAVASGHPGAALQFGALPAQTPEEEWDFLPRFEPSTLSVSEMLDGATFALPLQRSGDSTAIQPSRLAVWGRGERVSLSGKEEEVSWDGDLWSAHLGADRYIRPDLLAGAALSYAEGEVDTKTTDHDGSRIAGTYETTLTAIHPYVSHVLADGSHLWGSMGYGQGEVRIREGSATRKTDLSQWSVALGGRRVLLEDSQRIAGGITRIALKGEGALAQLDTDAQEGLTELTVKTTRLRVLVEGSHERALEDDATLTPALEAGLRHDGGDLGSGLGLEAGASLTWRNPRAGWLAELRARSLLAHEKDRDEWGISALVRMEPGVDGRGLSLTFGPEYGYTDSGMESWFDYSPTLETANSAARDDREGRLEAELGYGIGVSRTGAMALLTPYTGFSLAQSGAETFRVGARYRLGEGLSVGIEGKHQPQAVGKNSLMLRAAIRW